MMDGYDKTSCVFSVCCTEIVCFNDINLEERDKTVVIMNGDG